MTISLSRAMKADRFFSVHYDIRHNPKIELLCDLEGGMIAFGRWIRLMCILYDVNGLYDITAKAKRRYLVKELELRDEDDLRGFLQSCAECDLLSAELLEMGHVVSPGVTDQIEFQKQKSEIAKKAVEARWSKGKK